MTAKTDIDEVNGDRGAQKEPKTKREEAEEEKKVPQEHPRSVTTISLALPPWAEMVVLGPRLSSAGFGELSKGSIGLLEGAIWGALGD